MDGPWLPDEGVQALQRYLIPNEEQLVFVLRRHWITLAEPFATVAVSAFVMVFLASSLNQGFAEAAAIVILLWLILVGRALYRLLEWRASWFGSTQRRLMLTYGLFTRKVAMMPLEKVTDMSYARSPMGQLLGYGEFVLESAGQEQALRSVTFVPDPDQIYRRLISTMFGPRGGQSDASAETEPSSRLSAQSAKWTPVRSGTASWRQRVSDLLANAEPTVELHANEPESAETPARD